MIKNSLFFSRTDASKISSYLARINDERCGGEIGYYDLWQKSQKLIFQAKEFLAKKSDIKNIVLVGMGGSSCGLKALRDLLSWPLRENVKKLFILDNTSASTFYKIVCDLNLSETLFLIVSKSGVTIEVISLFKLIIAHFNIQKSEIKKHFIFISDENSKLHKEALKLSAECFLIPKNVGGRFSIFSAVGIIPLCLIGADAFSFLNGAKACFDDFFTHKRDEILQKAYHFCTHKKANINVLFSYGDEFAGFNEWYIQLIAESLGKKQGGFKRVGLTPVALIGARDQHSFLQLIMDGPKDKTITFLRAKSSLKFSTFDLNSIKIPAFKFDFLPEFNTNNFSLQNLLNIQCEATMKALCAENLSVDLLELDALDEWHAGYLMYYYELFTSVCGAMLGINAYDQPGVEAGKLILKTLLKN